MGKKINNSKKKKKFHIKYAFETYKNNSDFRKIHFIHNSFPNLSLKKIDTKVFYFNRYFSYPIYINSLTGGTKESKKINLKLAKISKKFNIPFVVGSQKIAVKKKSLCSSFSIIRKINPKGFLISNMPINSSLRDIKKAIFMIKADALSLYVNAAQKIISSDEKLDFSNWINNLRFILKKIKLPIIVKEIGNGMSKKTVKLLYKIGIKYVDISGYGGTNFVKIESKYYKKNYNFMDNWGISTVDSLILNKKYMKKINIFASGGIVTPLDVLKCMVLGAKAVGISMFFLKLIYSKNININKKLSIFFMKLRKIMLLLGIKNFSEVNKVEYYYKNFNKYFLK